MPRSLRAVVVEFHWYVFNEVIKENKKKYLTSLCVNQWQR